MSWSIHEIKGKTVAEAKDLLAAANAPQPIKDYIAPGIDALLRYGDGVLVDVTAYGHVCDGPDSYDVTSATIEVKQHQPSA